MKIKKQLGFSLLELMVTVVLISILLVVAVPSLSPTMQSNRLVSINNTLVALINNARQIAIGRGQKVIMCHTANENALVPTCGGVGSSWSNAVLIFATTDNPNMLRNYNAGTDEIIQRVKVNSSLSVVASADAANYIGFSADGTVFESTDTPVFAVCDDRGESKGRLLRVNPTGQLKVGTPTNCLTPS